MRLLLQGILITLSLLSGCATTSAFEYVPINWRLIDHPDERRIEIRFKNELEKDLCGFSDESWPNEEGWLNEMSDAAVLVVGNERFPIEDFNTGVPMCSRTGCPSRRVRPGEEINGFMPYAHFSLPERLRYEAKTLEFFPKARVCG